MSGIICKSGLRASQCLTTETCYDILDNNTTALGCLFNITGNVTYNTINANLSDGTSIEASNTYAYYLYIFMIIIVVGVLLLLGVLFYKGWIHKEHREEQLFEDTRSIAGAIDAQGYLDDENTVVEVNNGGTGSTDV